MTRPGLTLLELVVVLAILAVLTLVAVVSTDSVVDQGRFDVTQRTLQNVDDAIIGSAGQPDAPSFVGDVGRLPLSWIDPADTGGELQPAELWANVNSVRPFGPATDATADPDVTLLVGWRGPYLRLPVGQLRLRDGWGNPLMLFQPDVAAPRDTPVTAASQSIATVVSSGGATPPYNMASVLLSTDAVRRGGWTGTVQGSIEDTGTTTAGTADVTVKLFVPDLTTSSGIKVLTSTATVANGYRYSFSSVPVGPKAIRVYQGAVKGPVIYLRVPQGGLSRTLNFDIQ